MSVNDGGTTGNQTPSLGFTTTGDVKTTTCSVDGGAAGACTSPFTTPKLGDGKHTVTVTATDYFGQTGTGNGSATVDTTGPKLKIAKGPKKKSAKAKAKFKISTDGDASLTCKVDKSKPKSCSKKFKVKVKPGKHKLVVTATDPLWQRNDGPTYKWKVVR